VTLVESERNEARNASGTIPEAKHRGIMSTQIKILPCPPLEKEGIIRNIYFMLPFNRKLKPLARNLRSNMTDAEQLIWSKIRRKQITDAQFYRQKNIGNYIVDFYCAKRKLIIEVDGGQHYNREVMKKDQERNRYLQGLGLTMLRFSDIDVLNNIDGVVERIHEHLKSSL
jgi:very-short-patch-repair endonuclease